uniref:Nuclear receptor domain-containing protein n=1 Tax=Heterorhabditis bacteriophora TaxID=37862 RepID=A0A1I7X386_HETBA
MKSKSWLNMAIFNQTSFSSTVWNPCLYALMNEQFRIAFGSLLRTLKGDDQKAKASRRSMVGVESVLKPALDAEACPVCGDRVSGYHYGLLTCESCKVGDKHVWPFLGKGFARSQGQRGSGSGPPRAPHQGRIVMSIGPNLHSISGLLQAHSAEQEALSMFILTDYMMMRLSYRFLLYIAIVSLSWAFQICVASPSASMHIAMKKPVVVNRSFQASNAIRKALLAISELINTMPIAARRGIYRIPSHQYTTIPITHSNSPPNHEIKKEYYQFAKKF